MEKIIIDGNHTLTGTIKVSGAKNSAVALVPASLLADDKVTIDNIPNISDIEALNEILEYLGAKVNRKEETMEMEIPKEEEMDINFEDEINKYFKNKYQLKVISKESGAIGAAQIAMDVFNGEKEILGIEVDF